MKKMFLGLLCLTMVIASIMVTPLETEAAGERWVLVSIVEDDGKAAVDAVNAGGVRKASSSSKLGDYTYSWEYLGEGDTYYDPDLLEGENSTSQCTFSTPPTTIQGGETVTLSFKLSFGKQLLSYWTDNASASADFDKWDVEPGMVTGGSIRFKNKDGKSHFKIDTYKTVQIYTVSDTISAIAPKGSKEGDKIALRTMFDGVGQGTSYIYEWSASKQPMAMPSKNVTPEAKPTPPKTQAKDPNYVDSGIRVSDLYGEVEVRRGDNEDVWDLVELDTVLYVGDHIRTSGNSGCILSMLDMTTFIVKEESEIIITVPSGQESKLDLIIGNIYTNIQEIITHGNMEIEMNQAVAGIKGTTFVCEETGSKSTLKVLEGVVSLTSKKTGKAISVGAGEMAVADKDGELSKKSFNIETEAKAWNKTIIEMTINQKLMKVNGVKKEIDPGRDTTPVIYNSRTLIPIRSVMESLGGSVGYDAKDQKITLTKGKDTLEMWIGKTTIKMNGKSKTMDVAPLILKERTMVPVRFVAENFGYSVAWKAATQTVVIQ